MATEKAVMLVIRTARPEFRNNQDKAAFAVHAAFMAGGYTLHSTGLPAFESRILESCPVTDEVGWEKWNELLDYYGFLYSHPEQAAAGSKRVLMKSLVIKKRMYVDVLKEGDSEEIHHLEFNFMEYVEKVCSDKNYASQFKNLAKLVANVNNELLSKLDGSSTSTAPRSSTSSSSPRPDQPTPSTRTEVNLTGTLQIQFEGPCFPPLPPLILHTHLPNPPWHFDDGPAAETMPNGPYPRHPQQNWCPPPPTPNFFSGNVSCSNFDRAPGGHIGGRTNRGNQRPCKPRLNLR